MEADEGVAEGDGLEVGLGDALGDAAGEGDGLGVVAPGAPP